jgi:transcription antitermination factor NusG
MRPVISRRWYALRVRWRHEKAIASALHNKGYEVFLPLHRSARHWSDRLKYLELPLFPGYLFCRFQTLQQLSIMTPPGIIEIVRSGKTLVPLDDGEIATIQSITSPNFKTQPWPFLESGNRFRINHGPLSDLEGILVSANAVYFIVLSVKPIERSVAVEIDPSWMN